jgi:hypothetical protein
MTIFLFGCVDIGNPDMILRLNTKYCLDGHIVRYCIAVVRDLIIVPSSSTSKNIHTLTTIFTISFHKQFEVTLTSNFAILFHQQF